MIEQLLDSASQKQGFGVLALTHTEKTGVRVFNKGNNSKYIDIIIDQIDKPNKDIFFILKTYNGHSKPIHLAINCDEQDRHYMKRNNFKVYYNNYTDYVLTLKNNKKQSFFGIQICQGQDRENEIKVGYYFPNHRIEKADYHGDMFARIPRNVEITSKEFQMLLDG